MNEKAKRFVPLTTKLNADDFLGLALSAERWIHSGEYKHGDGIAWRIFPENQQKTEGLGSPNGFYNGAAGMILFYLTLYDATDDTRYLETARKAGDGIISTSNDAAVLDGRIIKGGSPYFTADLANSEWNVYAGAPSEGCPLIHLSEATGDPKYRAYALKVGDAAIAAAHSTANGIAWMDETGLLFDGGVALYLVYLYNATKDEKYREAAVRAARQIAETGTSDPRGGWHWQAMSPSFRNKSPDTYWPNFEFGTAGIGFLMATVYEATGDAYFLDKALKAAEHIRAIATQDGDSALVYYEEPGETDLYYLGNCHGAVGDAKFFYKLYSVTGDELHKEWVLKLYRGLLKAKAPHIHSPGYWRVQCRCCGTAGMLEFFLSLWAAFGGDEYLAKAVEAGETLAGEAFNIDGHGARWYQAWTRTDPYTIDAHASYEIGAAGDAAALAALSLALRGNFHAWRYIYDPWPATTQKEKLR
jgi:lantibiotic modifying enzyme